MTSTGGSERQSNRDKGDDKEMLGDYPIDVVLLATDLDATRHFYRNKIGLELLNESTNAVTFECGSNQLVITKSTVGTADEQTQAAWGVKDLDAELDALRGRGVRIEDYDLPGLKTVDGVADIGFARMAWFIDPAKNCLGIMQLK
jgi:catechol 2,3-dioxygenase-like lactoylglutathione lyase family enzyme